MSLRANLPNKLSAILAAGLLCLPTLRIAQAQSAVDIESMEACLAESVMVAEPGHCTGLHSDACIAGGEPVAECLDEEEAVWDAILREHWYFRCGTCRDGFSLIREIRARSVATRPRCNTDQIAAKRCLMEETARQASHVFLNQP